MELSDCKMGIQVEYSPDDPHISNRGFVTIKRNGLVGVRFWSNRNPGGLRNYANSEFCKPEHLKIIAEEVPAQIIFAWLLFLGYGGELSKINRLENKDDSRTPKPQNEK